MLYVLSLPSNCNNKEGFQYLWIENGSKEENKYDTTVKATDRAKAVEYIPVTKKNVMLEVPVLNYDECYELCRTTPDCDGFNYALEKCTLYRKLGGFKPKVALYRYW